MTPEPFTSHTRLHVCPFPSEGRPDPVTREMGFKRWKGTGGGGGWEGWWTSRGGSVNTSFFGTTSFLFHSLLIIWVFLPNHPTFSSSNPSSCTVESHTAHP